MVIDKASWGRMTEDEKRSLLAEVMVESLDAGWPGWWLDKDYVQSLRDRRPTRVVGGKVRVVDFATQPASLVPRLEFMCDYLVCVAAKRQSEKANE
jgi:hypothetical protein